jgi:enediyne biosynthesis protein E4
MQTMSIILGRVLLLGLVFSVYITLTIAQDTPNIIAEPFADVSEEAGITATHSGEWQLFEKDFDSGYLGIGQAWGDYDNDGWLDLYVTGNLHPNVLYHNGQDGTFDVSEYSDSVSLPDIRSGGTIWADYDNDGWMDLYVVNFGANTLYRNNEGTGFSDVTEEAGVGDTAKGTSASWADYDSDGDLDLYVANWSCFPECNLDPTPEDNVLARDTLYRNNADGTFTDVTYMFEAERMQGSAFIAGFIDYDDDGDNDIYIINDMFKNPIGNVLWRNDGEGCAEWCWTEISKEAQANIYSHGMGLAVGDYDNDLDLDFYFTDIVNRFMLLQNQNDGTFIESSRKTGIGVGPSSAVGWATDFFDYNNDGWLDLYVTTTEFIQYDAYSGPEEMLGSYPDFLFNNNHDGTFDDATPRSFHWSHHPTMGFAYADYDNDGLLDYVVGHWNEGYALFRNTGAEGGDNHWLRLRLTGGGEINQNAIGARAYVTGEDGHVQVQEVVAGRSLGAGNDLALHFGLGEATSASIRIVWPDRTELLLDDVASNQIIDITYGD